MGWQKHLQCSLVATSACVFIQMLPVPFETLQGGGVSVLNAGSSTGMPVSHACTTQIDVGIQQGIQP